MLNQILLIHLYRPFLRYTKANTPLPSHVSPRKICTQAASAISKLMRMYKRTYGLKQICNIVVYIAHTACTIHILNLPGKNSERDVIHGLRNLEEMADGWLAARRTLRILDISAQKWQVPIPLEARNIFERTHAKWGSWGSWDQAVSPSPSDDFPSPPANIATITNPISSSIPYSNPTGTRTATQPIAMPIVPTPSNAPPPGAWAQGVGPEPVPHMTVTGQPSQRPRYEAPDTSYLSPMPHVRPKYEMPPAMAASGPTSSGQTAWFHPPGNPVMPQTTMSPSSNDSPVSGLDNADHLVEESHDWWNQNAAAGLEIGMSSWGAGWVPMPGMPAQSSSVQFGNPSDPLMPMAPQSGVSMAQHNSHDAPGVSDIPSTAQGEMPDYRDQWG